MLFPRSGCCFQNSFGSLAKIFRSVEGVLEHATSLNISVVLKGGFNIYLKLPVTGSLDPLDVIESYECNNMIHLPNLITSEKGTVIEPLHYRLS